MSARIFQGEKKTTSEMPVNPFQRDWRWVFFPLLFFFTSCTELLYLNIEQMVPPEIMPKQMARSVGVVSNFSPSNVIVVDKETLILPCDADSVKEHLALLFAEACILDRVVVLDSLLYPEDSTRPHLLEQDEVNALCQQLDVEMLYSLEYACVTVNTAPQGIMRPVNAYICIRTYLPDTEEQPGSSSSYKKMIEYMASNPNAVRAKMDQAPQVLAETALAPYLPSWKERERVFYYDRLSYSLREAQVYVKENNWEEAAREWQLLTDSRHRPYRYMGYYNLALYHEMTDHIDQAIASLDLAEPLAKKYNKKGKETGIVIDTALLRQYREVLQNRKKELEELEKMATERNSKF